MSTKHKDLVVMIIGSGGREATLAWKIAQSSRVKEIIVAPGNYGISCMRIPGTKIHCVKISEMNFEELAQCAKKNHVKLTVVGPEAPLVAGIVDFFMLNNLPIFGPTAAAAQLEGSKWFAKTHMAKYGVPTAQVMMAHSAETAWKIFEKFASDYDLPVVIKANGLWGGKGVFICYTPEEVREAIQKIFAKEGEVALIEQFVPGHKDIRRAEISVTAVVSKDGSMLVFPESQDHKARFESDQGSNTGGMGAFSPVSWYTQEIHEEVARFILGRTINGMKEERTHFTGCLYAGLKLSPKGMMVLEFNCRFGDPEAQVVFPRIKSDIVPILLAVAHDESLEKMSLEISDQAAVCVVKCSEDYPGKCTTGHIINGTSAARKVTGVTIFPAGVARGSHGALAANGGRVIGVTAEGKTIEHARRRAYSAASAISWNKDGKRYDDCRQDIGIE